MGGGIQHLKECGFLPVLCPLKCVESDGERRGEVVRVERRQLAEHEREYCSQRELKCEFCGGAVRACEMNPHLGECEEFPVDCPNGCEAAGETGTRQMKRGAIPLHLTECPLQRVECPYREYGCDEEMERRQLAEHANEFCSQRELKCKFCGGVMRACEMNPHLGECEEFPVDCPNGCEAAGEACTRQMKRGAVPLHLAECPLQRVECPYREYGCGEEMERRQLDLHEREYMHTHFRLAMKEMKRKKIESIEESVSVKMEIRELKALSSDMKQKYIESNGKIELLEKENTELKNELRELKDNQILEVNDKIKCLEKQYKELKENISILVSTGQLDWKIKGVKQKIEKKENIYSEPFYVGLYKCQGSIVWDCCNTGKVGCFVHILKGKFDNKLKWPFIYRFKFVLLNQDRNEDDYIRSHEITEETLHYRTNCFKKPTDIRNEGFGTSTFISNTEILTWKYYKNDYISIHITVEQLPAF